MSREFPGFRVSSAPGIGTNGGDTAPASPFSLKALGAGLRVVMGIQLSHLDMSFVCPECGTSSLEILRSLELPADDWWDEVTVQTVACSRCHFRGAAVYEESRRGALDSEAWNHRGFRPAPDALRTVEDGIRSCPAPRDPACECATHRAWAGRDVASGWPLGPARHADFAMIAA
jgi:hypothetical protein